MGATKSHVHRAAYLLPNACEGAGPAAGEPIGPVAKGGGTEHLGTKQ